MYIIFGRDVPQNKRAIIADASHRYISPGHNALWLRAFNKWYITASGDELIAEIYVSEDLWNDIKKWGGEISNTQDGDTFISYPPKAFDGILSYIKIGEISDPNQIKRERHVREKELDKLGKTDVEAYLKRLNDERREIYLLLPLTRDQLNERVKVYLNPDGSINNAGWLFDKIIYKEHLDRDKFIDQYNKAMSKMKPNEATPSELYTINELVSTPSLRKLRSYQREALLPLYNQHVEYLMRAIATAQQEKRQKNIVNKIIEKLPKWHQEATCHEVALNSISHLELETHENDHGTEREFMHHQHAAGRDLTARIIWELLAKSLLANPELKGIEPYDDLEGTVKYECPYCHEVVCIDYRERNVTGYHADGTPDWYWLTINREYPYHSCPHFILYDGENSWDSQGALAEGTENLPSGVTDEDLFNRLKDEEGFNYKTIENDDNLGNLIENFYFADDPAWVLDKLKEYKAEAWANASPMNKAMPSIINLKNLFIRISNFPNKDLKSGHSYSSGMLGEESEKHKGLSGYSFESFGTDTPDKLTDYISQTGLFGKWISIFQGDDIGTGPSSENLFSPDAIIFKFKTPINLKKKEFNAYITTKIFTFFINNQSKIRGFYNEDWKLMSEYLMKPKNKAMRLPAGFEYAEKPARGTSKAITLTEVKAWVKKLGLGKIKDVTTKTKEAWLKKIVKSLGPVDLTSRATITIEEETGFRSGKQFLPVDKEKRKRMLYVAEGQQVGGSEMPASMVMNLTNNKRLEIILNITPIAEDKEYYCSENALATVLRHFNPGLRKVTPDYLHDMGCDSFPNIKKCFSLIMDIHYKLVDNTTIAQVRASLRRNYPVIASIIPNANVKWGNGKERHTVVINGINLKNDLSIIDNGHIKFQSFRAFVQEWNRTNRKAYIWSKKT
jgi:hypothetical protein